MKKKKGEKATKSMPVVEPADRSPGDDMEIFRPPVDSTTFDDMELAVESDVTFDEYVVTEDIKPPPSVHDRGSEQETPQAMVDDIGPTRNVCVTVAYTEQGVLLAYSGDVDSFKNLAINGHLENLLATIGALIVELGPPQIDEDNTVCQVVVSRNIAKTVKGPALKAHIRHLISAEIVGVR